MSTPKLEALAATNDVEKKKEPALNTGLTVSSVTGILYLVTLLFPNLPSNVVTAIYTVVAIVIPLLTAFLIRGKVWSPASVAEILDEASAEVKKIEPIRKPKPPTLLS